MFDGFLFSNDLILFKNINPCKKTKWQILFIKNENILTMLRSDMTTFEHLPDIHANDPDF